MFIFTHVLFASLMAIFFYWLDSKKGTVFFSEQTEASFKIGLASGAFGVLWSVFYSLLT